MVNLQDYIEANAATKKFTVDELLFAEFKCPLDDKKSAIWWHNNFFAHILMGQTVLQTPEKEYTLNAGDSVFAKKGSIISHNHINEDFCELLIFIPDDFIRTVIKKYNLSLGIQPAGPADAIIHLAPDDVLNTYFQSLLTHFFQSLPPAEPLLKLKFEELLLTILSTNNQVSLKNYFSELCRSTKPSIRQIMEANFFSNLSLEEFARLCNRSLTAFKKEFSMLYSMPPGKWLLEKRLVYSHYLLETTDYSLDEICLESGFENQSHFTRTFKTKYGLPPGKYKLQKAVL